MQKQTLPNNWQWATIAECADVITGNTPSKKEDSTYGDYLPLIKPPVLSDGVITEANDHLSIKGAEKARILPPNSFGFMYRKS
ncbi:MAG: hypothetical protein JXA42_03470 [Anaerolineales bacterium]|nr:hypothetical protein [Anaerolineales bacterium]